MISRRHFISMATLAPLARRLSLSRLLAFGDSITVGDGATDHALGFAQLVANQCSMVLDNRAVSSTTIAQHRAAIEAAGIEPSDTVLFLTGFNDMRFGTPLNEYRADLRAALVLAPRAYVGNCLRMPESSYALLPYNAGSDARVAEFNGIIAEETHAAHAHLVNASTAYDTKDCDDLVHPNNAGHAHLARAFLGVMRRVVYVAALRSIAL